MFKRLSDQILNSKGMGMVEVLTIVSIGTIAMIAALSSMQNSIQSQRQNQVRQTARILQLRVQNLFEDSAAWNQTVANNPSMACLQNGTPCATTTWQNFDIYDGSNNATPKKFYASLTTTTSDGTGFDESGNPCPAPPPAPAVPHLGAGSECPFGFVVSWKPICVGGPPCTNPSVQLQAEMVYWPARPGAVLNPKNYSVGMMTDFIRNTTALEDSFQLADEPSPSTAGGGPCTAAGVIRFLRVKSDPYNKVTPLVPNGAGEFAQFQINKAGTYKCSASAVGFGVGAFQIALKSGATTIATGNGNAPQWIQSSATLDALFTAPAGPNDVPPGPGTVVTLTQKCASPSTGFDLGLPAGNGGYYPQSTFATIVCVQVH